MLAARDACVTKKALASDENVFFLEWLVGGARGLARIPMPGWWRCWLWSSRFPRWGLKKLEPEARAVRQHRNAVWATVMWVAAALGFAGYVWQTMGAESGDAVSGRVLD